MLNGNVVGKVNAYTSGSASGIWSKTEQFLAKTGSNWPLPMQSGSAVFSNNKLSLPTDAAFTFGTGSFCVELWFKGTWNGYIFDFGVNGNRIQVAGSTMYFYPSAGSYVTTSTSGYSTSTWYHLAMVRNGGTLTGYVNGTSVGSTSNSSNLTDTTCTIGAYSSSNGTISGSISNFRVVKGYPIYTSNFTVPTQPLSVVTGTTLLTCQSSSTITDAGPFSLAITNNGVTTSSDNPFGL